jgi:hypothetical protein
MQRRQRRTGATSPHDPFIGLGRSVLHYSPEVAPSFRVNFRVRRPDLSRS